MEPANHNASPAKAPAVKATYEVVRNPQPQAIVVHCSDPRLQPAFENFIEHDLRLTNGSFIPIVIGGGAGVMAHPEQLPKEFKFLRDRLEFYREVFPTVGRVVLINHEDCHYYDSIKQKVFGFLGQQWRGVAQHARDDLPLVSRVFGHLLSHLGMTLELYYGKFADADRTRMSFEKVVP